MLGHAEEVRKILEERDINLMAKSLFDWTALHYAAEGGFVDVCKVILDSAHAVDVNARSKDGVTSVLIAVKNGFLDVVKLLAEHHADLAVADKFGNTALHYAKSLNSNEMIEYLIENNPALHFMEMSQRAANHERSVAHTRTSFGNIIRRCTRRDTPEKMICGASPTRYSERLSPATRNMILQYEPYCKLGVGCFGDVYLCKDTTNGREVALKVMKKSMLYENSVLKYALTERSVLMSIQHPFLCHMYDCFQTPSRLILVLEYYPGGTLRAKLDQMKKFQEDLARMYTAEVFLALEYLHRCEIAYRDLKLENVMIDAEGHLRLVDFGLAKENMTDDDFSDSYCGTPCYLAPEMTSQKKHNKMVDWYMLGCFLYEMLTGRPPFFAVEMSDLNRLTEAGDVQFPKTMSKVAKSLISMLMHKDLKERLGAGRPGRKAIQAHPFFEGIDWKQAYERRLPVPPAEMKNMVKEEIRRVEVLGSLKDDKRFEHVFGW